MRPSSPLVGPESPVDRALSLALASDREGALRWAAAVVAHDATMPTALLVTGRLLGELGRNEAACDGCRAAVSHAIDRENLPLATAAAWELARFGGDGGREREAIAEAFCKTAPHRGSVLPPPPPLPPASRFQALTVAGPVLLDEAARLVRAARERLDATPGRLPVGPLPLFSSIGRPALRELLGDLTPRWLLPGDTIIEQGTEGDAAFFVARGELEVRRRRGADELVLGTLSTGAVFGEMALLSRAPRTGSVVAIGPAIVLEARRASLDALADRHPEVGEELALHCRDRMVQNLLRTSPVLAAVPAADRAALVARFQPRMFERGERLITQGEPPPGLYLIALGEVSVVRRDEAGGDPLVLSTLGTGEVVGEVATVLRRLPGADVVAVHPTVTLFLPTADFLGLVRRHPAILAELYFTAVRRDEETAGIVSAEASLADDFDLV